MPTAGLPVTSAMPRAAAMPMRRPVNEPGPTVTAMRIEIGEGDAGFGHGALDLAHQDFGMAAADDLGTRHDGRAGDDADRAGFQRGVDGEEAHPPRGC